MQSAESLNIRLAIIRKVNVLISLNNLRATRRHLPYGITQCYIKIYTVAK